MCQTKLWQGDRVNFIFFTKFMLMLRMFQLHATMGDIFSVQTFIYDLNIHYILFEGIIRVE